MAVVWRIRRIQRRCGRPRERPLEQWYGVTAEPRTERRIGSSVGVNRRLVSQANALLATQGSGLRASRENVEGVEVIGLGACRPKACVRR